MWEDGTAWPDVKVPHTHPHSQFIPSQSQTVTSKEVLGIFRAENSKELAKGRGDRGCVMKIPQGVRLLLGICITPDQKVKVMVFYQFSLTPPTRPPINKLKAIS